MKNFEINISPEKERKKFSHMKVFRVRHGDTQYHEHTQGKKMEREDLDVTPKGEMQMDSVARIIGRRLNKENDVICVIASPRVRTQNGKKIFEEYFKKKGFSVLNNKRIDLPQERIKSVDIYDDAGNVVPVGDEKHPALFERIVSDLEKRTPEGMSRDAYMFESGHENLESFEESKKRSRRQLAGFMRIAKNIQLKFDKHIVIIQIEHCETLDDFYEQASGGEYSMISDSGPKKGEVVELDIPVEGNEIEVEFIGRERGKKRKVRFDYLSKNFLQEEKK
ncbi:MAG: phosphoglycerate mutase family protein [Candidatus Moraniibacteriota bacterium]